MLSVGFGFVSDAEAGLERDVQNIVDSRSQYGLAGPAPTGDLRYDNR